MLRRLASPACVRFLSRRARPAADAPPAVLVVQPRGPDADAELREALRLAEALPGGHTAAHALVQRVRTGAASSYFGSGTVVAVAEQLAASGVPASAQTVVVNARLSGAQERNLSAAWGGARTLDRVGLIISCFTQRATTAEAALQVQLAALSHEASRLVRARGGGGSFGSDGAASVVSARQRGGSSAIGGEGETELTLQRRRLAARRAALTAQLAAVARTRALHRSRRVPGLPPLQPDELNVCAVPPGPELPPARVALVGYTNAGKSSLAAALLAAGGGSASSSPAFAAQDKLFSTLDTTTRAAALPSRRRLLLSDTVGFVRALPPQLVAAFRSTLAEAAEADVLLHVIDASAPAREASLQRAAVREALRALGLSEARIRHGVIEVYNKMDALGDDLRWQPPADASWLSLPVSAARGDGLALLRHAIDAAAQLAACRSAPPRDTRALADRERDDAALAAALAAAGQPPAQMAAA